MIREKSGIVAVLDALGAADFDTEQVKQFIDYRDLVLSLLSDKMMAVGGRSLAARMTKFIFNDTVILALSCREAEVSPADFCDFFLLARKLMADSLVSGILFRGAISFGKFVVDDESTTVMGPAIADAARWHARTDWIGIVGTPRMSMHIQSLPNIEGFTWRDYVVEYEVPLKAKGKLRLEAVNWPIMFHKGGAYTPPSLGVTARQRFLGLLAKVAVPDGAEGKFLNTRQFFDSTMLEDGVARSPR